MPTAAVAAAAAAAAAAAIFRDFHVTPAPPKISQKRAAPPRIFLEV